MTRAIQMCIAGRAKLLANCGVFDGVDVQNVHRVLVGIDLGNADLVTYHDRLPK